LIIHGRRKNERGKSIREEDMDGTREDLLYGEHFKKVRSHSLPHTTSAKPTVHAV
jgi:hypothetical protein